MYITDVIEQVNTFAPNEYGKREMLVWCDEVSSMLSVEEKIIYKERTLPIAKDKTVLLPEGVEPENIVRIYMGGHELERRAYPSEGRSLYLPPYLNFHFANDRCTDNVRIVYEQPYERIRLPEYKGSIEAEGNNIGLCDCEFIPGDELYITVGDKAYSGIIVLEIKYSPDKEHGYIMTVSGELDGLSGVLTASVKRMITDKTVCDAPYDAMYVDYVLAKIALYQKDAKSYDLYMNRFNAKLSQYRDWLTARTPHNPGGFKNWWKNNNEED